MLSGGDYYGDYTYIDTEDFVIADNCLGYGPGINVVSSEISPADEEWQRFYYAVSENTATGEKITGTFSSQNGQNFDYKASHDDFEFVYDGTWVTAEYRVPIIELYESFKEDRGGQMFKAAIVLTAGIAGQVDELSNEWVIPYSWGVRLGQYGYASDSGNTAKTWATFRLVDPDELPPEPGPGPTPEPPVTTPDETPKKTPDETPVVTPSETPDETPKVTPLETPDPETPDVTPDPETPDNTPDAPPTGDIMVVAAALSAISACGVMIAKKRR